MKSIFNVKDKKMCPVQVTPTMQGSTGTDFVEVRMLKTYNDIELKDLSCWVMVERPDGECFEHIAEVEEFSETLVITWTLNASDTYTDGHLTFLVKFVNNDDTVVFQTERGKLFVYPSIEPNGQEIPPNIFEQILAQVIEYYNEIQHMLTNQAVYTYEDSFKPLEDEDKYTYFSFGEGAYSIVLLPPSQGMKFNGLDDVVLKPDDTYCGILVNEVYQKYLPYGEETKQLVGYQIYISGKHQLNSGIEKDYAEYFLCVDDEGNPLKLFNVIDGKIDIGQLVLQPDEDTEGKTRTVYDIEEIGLTEEFVDRIDNNEKYGYYIQVFSEENGEVTYLSTLSGTELKSLQNGIQYVTGGQVQENVSFVDGKVSYTVYIEKINTESYSSDSILLPIVQTHLDNSFVKDSVNPLSQIVDVTGVYADLKAYARSVNSWRPVYVNGGLLFNSIPNSENIPNFADSSLIDITTSRDDDEAVTTITFSHGNIAPVTPVLDIRETSDGGFIYHVEQDGHGHVVGLKQDYERDTVYEISVDNVSGEAYFNMDAHDRFHPQQNGIHDMSIGFRSINPHISITADDESGEILFSSDIVDGTTSRKGLVQLTNERSNSQIRAITPYGVDNIIKSLDSTASLLSINGDVVTLQVYLNETDGKINNGITNFVRLSGIATTGNVKYLSQDNQTYITLYGGSAGSDI